MFLRWQEPSKSEVGGQKSEVRSQKSEQEFMIEKTEHFGSSASILVGKIKWKTDDILRQA